MFRCGRFSHVVRLQGATAVQLVPTIGEWAKQLYVFQRTPSSVDVRNNRPTDPEWLKSLKPGWQRERMINFVRKSARNKMAGC